MKDMLNLRFFCRFSPKKILI